MDANIKKYFFTLPPCVPKLPTSHFHHLCILSIGAKPLSCKFITQSSLPLASDSIQNDSSSSLSGARWYLLWF